MLRCVYQCWLHGDDIGWEVVHDHDSFLLVSVEFIDETEPINDQTRTKPETPSFLREIVHLHV